MTRQPCMKRLLAPIACLLMIIALASGGLGQKAGPAGGARKFDSFNKLHGCDLGARLDNFAMALQEDEGIVGYLITYGPPGEGYGTAAHNLHVMVDYLINSRGLDQERVKTIYGGPYKDPKDVETEMWVVPVGARPPEPRKYKNDLKSFTGMFNEYVTSDHLYLGESDGPYTPDPTFASFVDALRERTTTRAYIVVRSSPRAVTGAWRRVAKDIAGELKDGRGIADERVKIVFAGYDRKLAQNEEEGDYAALKVQLWILPEDAPPPAKEVSDERRRPTEAALIGSLDKYLLYDPDNAKHIFEGLGDVLNADGELRGCIIYHPSTEPPDPETESERFPRVDLNQLVEKWKNELATRYKIDEPRLIIIRAAATRESDDGTVQAWVVPPGAALPDAYPPPEEEEEYVEEAAEESPQNF